MAMMMMMMMTIDGDDDDDDDDGDDGTSLCTLHSTQAFQCIMEQRLPCFCLATLAASAWPLLLPLLGLLCCPLTPSPTQGRPPLHSLPF